MVHYKKVYLDNGLTLIVHEDPSTPLATVNLLYDVGSRDESPDKTGFAHLFEHLMFEGSANITDFDHPLYQAGGESNAFTSADWTNYYCTVPAHNLEVAFWLESDRMLQLDFNQASLDKQKQVVIEEFKETCFNKPYGDVWHKLQALSLTQHPYQWPVIGKSFEHIAEANLEEVKAFFETHYCPNRAILVVAGGVKMEAVKVLVEKWFGNIPTGAVYQRNLPKEPKQTKPRNLTIRADVPVDAIYLSFHMCARRHADYHVVDILTEILSGGASARLYQKLVKEQEIFTGATALLMGGADESLVFVSGKMADNHSIEEGEEAIWEELERLKTDLISPYELQRVKYRLESNIAFSEITLKSRAFYLAYFEWLGDIDEINREKSKYLAVTPEDVRRVARQIFDPKNGSTLYYLKR